MAKKEEIYPDGYPRQTDNFSDEQKFKFDVFKAIREIALDTTEKSFEDSGYEKKEGRAGEYGTGDSYGAGTSLDHFNIRLSSRPNTNTYFEKIIYFGGKKAISDVSIGWDAKNKKIELAYKTSEFAAFRGYHDKMSYDGAMLINDRRNFVIKDLADFKAELKKLFKSFADKEVAYITSTKVGIEDKTEKSINSMVEISMKKYNLKDLMTSSDEDLSNAVENYISEGKKEKEEKEDKTRMNNPEVVAANSPGKLLFDDKVEEEKEKKDEVDEVTGSAAAGAYLTPMAWKKGGDLNIQEEEAKAKFEKTSYAQAKTPRASVKKTMKEGDSFWTTVEINPGSGYVPKGMEHNFELGAHSSNTDKNYPGKVKPVKEGEEKNDAGLLKESLIKKKFSSLNENQEKGINKRYIITEQRTKKEEEDRWKKLAMFETYETINSEVIEECGCQNIGADVSMEQGQKDNERQFMQRNSDAEAGGEVDGKAVIMVAKPNSLSNAMFKVFEEDYLNEGKAYIKDLNSGNLVANPNFKAKK